MKPAHDFKALHVLDDRRIGLEARANTNDRLAVKTELRLLACSEQIQKVVRTRLRESYATTLPRFDYLAQLERHPQGLRMNALSRYLMVSGGNVTALTNQLVAQGWVERMADPEDARSCLVRLSAAGRRYFARLAAAHRAWVTELFTGLGAEHEEELYEMLGRLRVHLARKDTAGAAKRGRNAQGG